MLLDPSVAAPARRSRRRAVRALAPLIAAMIALGATAAVPAAAEPPPGALVELRLGPNGAFEGDAARAVTEGAWSDGISLFGADDPPDSAFGCASGKTFLALAHASEDLDDRGEPGSPERPAAQVGDLATDVFDYASQAQPRFNVTNQSWYSTEDWQTSVDTGFEVDQSELLAKRFPAGEVVSMVAYCVADFDPDFGYMPVVEVDSTGHVMVGGWLTFRTSASPRDPSLTSDGFEIVEPTTAPTVTLKDAWTGTTGTLTATLTGDGDAALTDATGAVDFYTGTGASRTLFGTAPVSATGTATIDVSSLPAGSETSFEAHYVPDAAAEDTYAEALSPRYTVVAPAAPSAPVAPVVTLTVGNSTYGRATSAVVDVRRGTAAAVGQVSVTVDGAAAGTATLGSGKAAVALPAALGAGSHTVTASYAGNDTTQPATTQATFSVGQATTATSVRLSPTKAVAGKTKVRAAITVSAPGLSSTPTGTVTVKVGSTKAKRVGLSAGTAAVKLPKSTKPGKVKVKVTYAGSADLAPSSGTATLKVKKAPKKKR